MPDTRTERMMKIADDLEEEGLYTRAASIRAVTEERDRLLKQIAAVNRDSLLRLVDPTRVARALREAGAYRAAEKVERYGLPEALVHFTRAELTDFNAVELSEFVERRDE